MRDILPVCRSPKMVTFAQVAIRFVWIRTSENFFSAGLPLTPAKWREQRVCATKIRGHSAFNLNFGHATANRKRHLYRHVRIQEMLEWEMRFDRGSCRAQYLPIVLDACLPRLKPRPETLPPQHSPLRYESLSVSCSYSFGA